MNLIDLDELKKYPIRKDHYDKEHGDVHYVFGVEDVLEYAEYLPVVDAIPVEWLYDLAEKKEEEKDIKLSLMIKGVVAVWHKEQEKKNESD